MTVEEFIEKCQRREIPTNPMAKATTLARELADGVANDIWEAAPLGVYEGYKGESKQFGIWFMIKGELETYLKQRWDNDYPNLQILIAKQYIHYEPETNRRIAHVGVTCAINLLTEADPAVIFISYSRKDSSPFALYTLEKLKQAGLDAFLDIELKVGEEWHGRLQKQIAEVNVFVVIIGENTLKSEYVQKEIRWAEGKTIYPIWESSFVNKENKWDSVPSDIAEIMQSTQAIEIPKEHPQHYLTAISQLLNRFGITP